MKEGRTLLPFIATSSFHSKEKIFDSCRLINVYAEKMSPTSRSKYVTRRMPGTVFFTDLPSLVIYGSIKWFEALYIVTNDAFYRVTATGTFVKLGTCVINDHVSIDSTQIHIFFCDGTNSYAFDIRDASLTKLDEDLSSVVCLDNYALGTLRSSGEFVVTDLLSVTFNPLQFANAEIRPDNLVCAGRAEREAWLFGTDSIEVFANNGDPDFPFGRVYGSYIPTGCAARNSLAEYKGSFFFLGTDDKDCRRIYVTGRFQTVEVSSAALNEVMANGKVDDAFAFIFTTGKNNFYQITFPSLNATWVLNLDTKFWHEANFAGQGRHIANTATFCYGKTIVGSYLSGRLLALDGASFQDDGDFIECFVATSPAYGKNQDLTHDALEITLEINSGLPGNIMPELRLAYSSDGGRTYRAERRRKFGGAGGFVNFVRFTALGTERSRNYGIWITDPVDFSIGDIWLDYSGE